VLLHWDGEVIQSDLLGLGDHAAEVPKQVFVVVISRASLSHLNETSRSP
jgi:hypothetical protein